MPSISRPGILGSSSQRLNGFPHDGRKIAGFVVAEFARRQFRVLVQCQPRSRRIQRRMRSVETGVNEEGPVLILGDEAGGLAGDPMGVRGVLISGEGIVVEIAALAW